MQKSSLRKSEGRKPFRLLYITTRSYPHINSCPQRKKKKQKERKDYDYYYYISCGFLHDATGV